ncbi:MAG: ion transporter [Verrucomicrobiota bacterium]
MVALSRKIIDSRWFTAFIIGTIVAAGIVVGIQTFPKLDAEHATLWDFLNRLILAIFTIEIVLKMTALAPRPLDYFKDGWNIFDFTIVAVCFLPFGGAYAAVLRLFRLLRVVRLITVIPKLQILVGALLKSLPSMFYVTILLFLLFYIYAVVGVMFFRENDPVHFGTLWTSLLSLFRVVTLEDWTDIMYIQMYGSDVYHGFNKSVEGMTVVPQARPILGAAYFVSFVLIGTMVMLNLVIGVIINGMDEAQKEIAERNLHELLKHGDEETVSKAQRSQKIAALRLQLEQITAELDQLK